MSDLEMPPEQMRALGHLAVDRLVDLIGRLDAGPVYTVTSPDEMTRRIAPDLSSGPTDFEKLLTVVENDVAPLAARWGHPRTFAYVPGRGTWPGALADLMISALNIDASSWRESPGPIHLELMVIEWFRTWLEMPESTGGLLVGGGSAANLTALTAARESRVGAGDHRARLYCTTEAHSSVGRAGRVIGFGSEMVRMVEVDDRGRMRSEALETAVHDDLTAGLLPVAVVASAGATNTGSVDPLAEIADIAARRRLWMHVDAAYGGFAVLTDRGRAALRGIERADSVTLDPHKWLYQPIEVGALLVRDSETLVRAFSMRPDYLQDTTDRPGEVNMIDRGLQQTRAVRALKVWMSLMTFGLDAFRAAIERSLDLALHVEQRVTRSASLELLSPAQLSIVCFRRTAASEVDAELLNRSLLEGLLTAGVGFISSTRVDGRYALRMCVLNHTTTEADVDAVLDWFES